MAVLDLIGSKFCVFSALWCPIMHPCMKYQCKVVSAIAELLMIEQIFLAYFFLGGGVILCGVVLRLGWNLGIIFTKSGETICPL